MPNEGVKFQEDFVASITNPEISLDRFKDPLGGQKGVANICDYVLYLYPFEYYFELKCYLGNTVNFSAFSDTQYTGLVGKLGIPGVVPGALIHYQDHRRTFFFHASDMRRLKEEGKKSIHILECIKCGVEVESERIRIRYRHNIDKLLHVLGCKYGSTD